MKMNPFALLFISAVLAAIVSAVVSLALGPAPSPQFGMIDFAGIIEDMEVELEDVDGDAFHEKTAEYALVLNEVTEQLKADGWILFPKGAVSGAQDITPEIRYVICDRLELLCEREQP